jgi:GntR family transcriptional regulator
VGRAPLYSQIVSVLESRIHSGAYAPGSLLGTEKELTHEFGVSRITVQKALDTLQREGLVDRQRARGTFVATSVQPGGPVELHGFLDDILLMGAMGETRCVERDEVPAPARAAERLGIPRDAPVVRVRRLRANNGVLNTWVINFLPLDIGRLFDAASVRSTSIVQLLDQLPGVKLAGGREYICARPADPDTAARLRIPPGTPILLVERELLTETGRPIDFAQFHYLGNPQLVRISRAGR